MDPLVLIPPVVEVNEDPEAPYNSSIQPTTITRNTQVSAIQEPITRFLSSQRSATSQTSHATRTHFSVRSSSEATGRTSVGMKENGDPSLPRLDPNTNLPVWPCDGKCLLFRVHHIYSHRTFVLYWFSLGSWPRLRAPVIIYPLLRFVGLQRG